MGIFVGMVVGVILVIIYLSLGVISIRFQQNRLRGYVWFAFTFLSLLTGYIFHFIHPSSKELGEDVLLGPVIVLLSPPELPEPIAVIGTITLVLLAVGIWCTRKRKVKDAVVL
jgi:hypothetical protein